MNEQCEAKTVNLMQMALEMAPRRRSSNGDGEDGEFWTYAVNAMQTQDAEIIR